MRIPPLYVCPDCEPGPYMYAGHIISKVCSSCARAAREARTGADRIAPGIDRGIREIFGRRTPAIEEFMASRRRWLA